MPGPPKKPTALRKLGARAHRKKDTNKNEPQPKLHKNVPEPPDFLDSSGKQEWVRMAPVLLGLGLLSDIDEVSLAAYCQHYAMWVKTTKRLQREGMVTRIEGKFPRLNPIISIQQRAQAEMRKWLLEFGMTPASRSRMSVAPPEEEIDPMEEFLKGGGIKAVD